MVKKLKELATEIKKHPLNYSKIEELIQAIQMELSEGNLPSQEDIFLLSESLKTVEAKIAVLQEEIRKLQIKKKIISTYFLRSK